jgi:hypothetical protein
MERNSKYYLLSFCFFKNFKLKIERNKNIIPEYRKG